MSRRSSGQVIPPKGDRQRSWAVRFTAYGKRRFVTLGRPEEGWTRAKAEAELRQVLADVERGIWRTDEPVVAVEPAVQPTFHEFSSEWLANAEAGLRPRTVKDYKWALELHLLPWFARHRLSDITIEEVDRYKAAKLREHQASLVEKPKAGKQPERKIGPNAINKTLTRLAQILEVAVEYGHLEKNPAKGRRRRVKGTEPQRSWVEAEQLLALLDASSVYLRPLVATLAGAGLRIGEALALTWSDVNLATGTITVRESKTAAGEGRQVDMPIGLHEALRAWRARTPRSGRKDPVFLTRPREGVAAAQTARNAQSRIKCAVKAANVELAKAGIEPISDKVSPHSLRRTYASLRAALRDDPVYIAEQLGHQDARFTFRVYQKAAKRRARLAGAHLQAFDRALEWAGMGREAAREAPVEQLPTSTVDAGIGTGKLNSAPVRL